ncbi:hypothetical protein LC087_10595 [Bacillus carboniphilus]|uniref:Uncharacterized protein n=1 Tax=Bacillus carboniphilus TaxID=86663 RepID=A0ABY9JPN0_9BACI|nr:hypothetical protein [Bacillus carboniphilus]WLR41361.1 hypothetical protein LC087_10595 [Bacillus carboniphilus]
MINAYRFYYVDGSQQLIEVEEGIQQYLLNNQKWLEINGLIINTNNIIRIELVKKE